MEARSRRRLDRGPLAWLARRRARAVAQRLSRQAAEMWSADPSCIDSAIERVERAWALDPDPSTAILLATMYDRVNRHEDALLVLRQALRAAPHHALVRHHMAITVLRHGQPEDVQAFVEGVLAVDPADAFAGFVSRLLGRYDGWVDQLVASIECRRGARPPFLIALPVWGAGFTDYCVRYFCASLLAPGNLAKLAESHDVHIAFFSSEAAEAALRASPPFRELARYATIDFVRYDHDLIDYTAAMAAGYGDQAVYYSSETLDFYYARNCKFALMSCAHYVALAAGRRIGALVSCQIADVIWNDGALPRMAGLMTRADAVLVHCLHVQGRVVRPLLEDVGGASDGVLGVSAEACASLVVRHMPEGYFADGDHFLDPPLRIAWRVGSAGVLVHGNHYHPICLRPAAFAHPLRLTIDPVDSRFLDRTSLEWERVALVKDDSIVCLGIDDDPILQRSDSLAAFSAGSVALWLWGYWGRLRGRLFRTPIRFGTASEAEWAQAEAAAAAVVDRVLADIEERERERKATPAGKAGPAWM
ncbi:MAG: hypothetical protein ACOY4R_12585 [Pseudomonadota bacterium]